jgi:hypothetical protein
MVMLLKQANDDAYKDLYEQARSLPNVNYIGYKPHEYILENLHQYHISLLIQVFGKKHFVYQH